MAAVQYYGTGKRKSSIARVWITPGTGTITVNKKSLDEYFGRETSKMIVKQPLELTENLDKFDIMVTVAGGGTWVRPALSSTASPRRSWIVKSPCAVPSRKPASSPVIPGSRNGRSTARRQPEEASSSPNARLYRLVVKKGRIRKGFPFFLSLTVTTQVLRLKTEGRR